MYRRISARPTQFIEFQTKDSCAEYQVFAVAWVKSNDDWYKVQEKVALPIAVYDDVLARRAVAVTADGGTICVAAMNTAALGPTKLAVEAAARQAGKRVEVDAVCVDAAKNCLTETGSTELADQYFERWMRANQQKYSAFVLPQVPLTRLMPRLRDMETPVFDSMEPFVDELAKM